MPVFEVSDLIGGDDVAAQTSSMFTQRHSFNFHVTGERYLNVEFASMGSVKLCRVSSSGHTVELTETENVTYLLPRNGSLDVTTRTAEFGARSGGAMIFSPNSRLTRVSPAPNGRFQAMALLVPVEMISKPTNVYRNSTEMYRLDRDLPANKRSSSERALIDYLNYLECEFDRLDSPFGVSNVRASAAALALDLFCQFISQCLRRDTRIVRQHGFDRTRLRRAEQIMQERFREPLAIVDVANELDISVRALQHSFNKVYGHSPRDVLNSIRLEASRARLSDPSDHSSIAHVALDCGFTHLSRFAAAYRARYNERPSVTRKRSRS